MSETQTIIETRMANIQKQLESKERPTTHEQREVQRQNRIAELRAAWNAPELQLNRGAIDRKGAWGETEKKLRDKLGSGFCVALIGKRGPGKTQMGVELMKLATERCRSAYYSTAVGFFLAIRATYKPTSLIDEETVIDRFARYSFLVLDEIGQRKETDWEDQTLFEMLDRRYRNAKDTLLISNQEYDKFCQSVGDSIASRMNETGGIIECNWKSYR